MDFKKLLSEAIDNNTKIIITGKSGWGKSEMVAQVAEEKGMELIDFRLSEVLPEDLVGIPKVKDDYYEYVPPRWLYEVVNNPDKKYLLFLDEITQGTPEVLNICYKIFDKVTKVGNYTLNNVSVVGATNYQSESNYLSELPTPLKNRACMVELEHNSSYATKYLIDKYNLDGNSSLIIKAIKDSIRESNPRSTDKVIDLILHGCTKNLCIPFVGLQSYMGLSSVLIKANKPEGLTGLDSALYDLKQGYVEFKNSKYNITEPEILINYYELSSEESSIIIDEFNKANLQTVEGARMTFMSDFAASKQDISGEELLAYSECKSFNGLSYLNQFKINEKTMTNQFEILKQIFNWTDKQLLRTLCERRTLPLGVMKLYRNDLPWDLLVEHDKKGWLTKNKKDEFRKELNQYASNC